MMLRIWEKRISPWIDRALFFCYSISIRKRRREDGKRRRAVSEIYVLQTGACTFGAGASGFFQPDGYTDKQHRDFGDYLRLRIRPAAEALIQRDALDKLQVLEELGWMDASVIENCMDYAIRNQKTQAFIWLLERKTRKYGFHDRSFDL